MKFHLTSIPIESLELKEELFHESTGAFNCFEGMVRNQNNGRDVIGLQYEAYPELCEKEVDQIFEEVKNQFNVFDAQCYHRIGSLKVGETAVWVGVTAAHRDAAFKACRYIIDQLKFRLPIWKKELYSDGDSGWIDSQNKQTPSFDRKEYYSRQTVLKEIGIQGQEKLAQSQVLVVGAGGLGCAALFGLVGSGIGTVGICEFDQLQESNLHRQFIYTHQDIGKPKIDLAADRIKALNPSVTIVKHSVKLEVENIASIIKRYDIVLDCTDNYRTKFLLNDAAVIYQKILIQASIYQSDGQIHSYIPHESACLRCLWPEIIQPGCIGNCAQAGVFGDVAAIFGHLQSLQTIKTILGLNSHIGETIVYDIKNHGIDKIKRPVDPSCPVCGKRPSIKALDKSHYQPYADFTVDIDQLSDEQILTYKLIDVREGYERVMFPLKNIRSIHLPCSEFSIENIDVNPKHQYLVFCAKGIRSLGVVKELHKHGRKNFVSIDNDFQTIQSRLSKIKDSSFTAK